MEFKSILIKDTTVEERKQIVKESLGNISANCDGCMARLSEMYDEYIEGKKEIRDINMTRVKEEAVRCKVNLLPF